MAAILSPLGLYGGNRKTKLPLRPNFRIRTTEGTLGIFVFAPSDRCPATANLLSLDASLAIPTRVLCFEVSGLRCRTPVGPVLLTGQTGTHRSDRSDRPNVVAPPSSVFGLGFVDQPRNLVVFS
jgi:hypothetical protein